MALSVAGLLLILFIACKCAPLCKKIQGCRWPPIQILTLFTTEEPQESHVLCHMRHLAPGVAVLPGTDRSRPPNSYTYTRITMAPGVGFIGRRLNGGQKAAPSAQSSGDLVTAESSEEQKRSLSHASAGVNDSVHSLHNMDRDSFRKQPPSPPSPTSTLQEVNFLDLGGSEEKSGEATCSVPDDEHTLTPDDPDWAWHEPALEVDPKDAATPDRSGQHSA